MSDQVTIRHRLHGLLTDSGMSDEAADHIIEAYIASKIGAAMRGRLDDAIADYPNPAYLLALTWMGVKKIATEWIDANCPEHWARPMFAEGQST